MIKYKLVAWEFNSGAWAAAMRDADELLGTEVCAQVLGVNPHTIKSWGKMQAGYHVFPYPNMTNFLKFCNQMDRDPRDFFMLEDA